LVLARWRYARPTSLNAGFYVSETKGKKSPDRIWRLILGNLGGVKPVGDGVSEIRIDFCLGYRVILSGKESGLLRCWSLKVMRALDIHLNAQKEARA